MQAVNYLDIYGLFDLTCQALADRVKLKTIEEIRKTFNIVSEEEEVMLENKNLMNIKMP